MTVANDSLQPGGGTAMVHFWSPEWARFRQTHGGWLRRRQQDEAAGHVLYRLPSTLVESLGRPLRFGRPILSNDDLAAERDLDGLCTKFQAVGVFSERPVIYPYLAPRPVAPKIGDLKAVGLNRSVCEVRKVLSRLEDISDRVKAYAACLIMDSAFRRDRDVLRERWCELPSHCRPWLPLDRTTIWRPADDRAAAFQIAFDAFCDRYGLLGMTTWELPHPAGPLLDGIPKAPHLLAGRAVVLALPAHFSLLGRDDLHELVQQLQRQHCSEAAVDSSCTPSRRVESHVHLLVIEHYQRVVLDRYGTKPAPKGLVNRLKEVLAGYLDLGPDHFKTLHRRLAAALRRRPKAVARTR